MFKKRAFLLQELISSAIYSLGTDSASEGDAFSVTYALLEKIKREKAKVYFIGNGGSCAIASHFAIDFLNKLEIPSFAFQDMSQTTCIANDFGYEKIFSLPLDRVLEEKDLLIAISSSGKSENILEGVFTARRRGACVMTFTGFSEENPVKLKGDINYWIPSFEYGLVETAHFILLHALVDEARELFLEKTSSLCLQK